MSTTNHSKKQCESDLHGYTVRDALDAAEQWVREAWENGYDTITLIHGSQFIDRKLAELTGRGAIKWALREHFEANAWVEYAYEFESQLHELGDAEMTIALRHNARPNNPAVWREAPKPFYSKSRKQR